MARVEAVRDSIGLDGQVRWNANHHYMSNELLSTGKAATLLGCSRQHVVDLCDSGRLASVRVGTHRRVRHSAIEALTRSPEESPAASLLHIAVAGRLVEDPDHVLSVARHNIENSVPKHRQGGLTAQHLHEWAHLIDAGVPAVLTGLLGQGQHFIDLRSSSPFAGVLTGPERRAVLTTARATRAG